MFKKVPLYVLSSKKLPTAGQSWKNVLTAGQSSKNVLTAGQSWRSIEKEEHALKYLRAKLNAQTQAKVEGPSDSFRAGHHAWCLTTGSRTLRCDPVFKHQHNTHSEWPREHTTFGGICASYSIAALKYFNACSFLSIRPTFPDGWNISSTFPDG